MMKQNLQKARRIQLAGLLGLLSLLSACCWPKDCCRGYKGPITSKWAIELGNKDHFIIKDSIIAWTERYQVNKALICHDSLPPVGDVLGDSCSFSRCFVKALLCNSNCIGLRVLYGMDTAKKVHIILVGIQPDYSTLYIHRPPGCAGSRADRLAEEAADALKTMRGKGFAGEWMDSDNYNQTPTRNSQWFSGPVGGLEYGQIP